MPKPAGVRAVLFGEWVQNLKMSLKLDGFLKPYRGKGDDLQTFWSKFQVLADIQKWDTEEKRMQHLPLLLDGQAFKVITAMAPDDRKKEADVKSVLEKAFAPARADAYQSFQSRRLRNGEAADGYVADLKYLLGLAGHEVKDEKDPVLLEQVIRGLPPSMAKDVRLQCAGKTLSVPDVTEQIRALQLVSDPTDMAAGAKSLYCFRCRKTGHVKRNCPEGRRDGQSSAPKQASSGVRCHHCHQLGHIRRNCPKRSAGNPAGGARSESGASDCCLSLSTPNPRLVRVYVDVRTDQSTSWTRLSSVVDTGCTRSMITRAALAQCDGTSSLMPCNDRIVALDGQPLQILGRVTCTLRRLDGAVHLDELPDASLLVVPELDVLGSDMIIGNDVVMCAGGMNLQYSDGRLSSVVFGRVPTATPATDAAAGGLPIETPVADRTAKLSRHVSVHQCGDNVTLHADDAEVHWNASAGYWSVKWHWKNDTPPSEPLGSGIGEYPRNRLTPEQETHFNKEVEGWIQRGWLVPHDEAIHGPPGAVLPLIAKCQEHKVTTPVRPVLDYRDLNDHIVNNPGCNTPVCGEKLRSWRQAGDGFKILDIRKAYLQVRLDPSMVRYQTVVYKGQTYVMQRMGFGLGIAPKVMSMIVQYVTGPYPEVDNYVDDLFVPAKLVSTVEEELLRYGLPTKPAENLESARVLGLQLHRSDDTLRWKRRADVDLCCPELPTKRDVPMSTCAVRSCRPNETCSSGVAAYWDTTQSVLGSDRTPAS